MANPPASHTAREKILAAAADIARSVGAGHLSLDAVAARAGVSKGGLLYHFPNKIALMRGLVQTFINQLESDLAQRAPGQSMLSRYVELTVDDCKNTAPAGSGILAAMAEDPELLKPIVALKRRLLDQLTEISSDKTRMLIVFMALEGMRTQSIFDANLLTPEEDDAMFAALSAMAAGDATPPAG